MYYRLYDTRHSFSWVIRDLISGVVELNSGWRCLLSWWRNQMETFSTLMTLCERNPPITVDSPKRPVTQMFSLICAWKNGWANNRDSGDLRRHRAHDVTIMLYRGSMITLPVILKNTYMINHHMPQLLGNVIIYPCRTRRHRFLASHHSFRLFSVYFHL